MKFLFVVNLAVLNISMVHGQVGKGSVLLGGELSGTSTKVTKDREFFSSQKGISFSPVYGKAVKDNLIVGGRAIVVFTKDEFTATNTKQNQNAYGAGVFIRRYYQVRSLPFYFFLEGRLSGIYSPFIQKTTQSGDKQNFNFYSIDLEGFPGISYALSPKFHLESGFINFFLVEYFHKKTEIISTTTTVYRSNTITVFNSLNNKANFFIGFRLLISK